MQITRPVTRPFAVSLFGLLFSLASTTLFGATLPTKAEVRGLLGRAQYSHAGAAFQAVAGGTTFEAGDVIQTAGGAAIDIDFGAGIGLVRLTESSTLVIEKWSTTESGYQIHFFLRDGEMLGRVAKPVVPSRFQVKVNNGLGGIVEGQFRLNSKGYLVQLDGKAGYVSVPATGEPVSYALTTPPAQYFSPLSGVHVAPSALVKEVNTQWRSKLPKL